MGYSPILNWLGSESFKASNHVRVRVNLSVRRAGRYRAQVGKQDVVETGYAPSS
jgi:hypothetical protein